MITTAAHFIIMAGKMDVHKKWIIHFDDQFAQLQKDQCAMLTITTRAEALADRFENGSVGEGISYNNTYAELEAFPALIAPLYEETMALIDHIGATHVRVDPTVCERADDLLKYANGLSSRRDEYLNAINVTLKQYSPKGYTPKEQPQPKGEAQSKKTTSFFRRKFSFITKGSRSSGD